MSQDMIPKWGAPFDILPQSVLEESASRIYSLKSEDGRILVEFDHVSSYGELSETSIYPNPEALQIEAEADDPLDFAWLHPNDSLAAEIAEAIPEALRDPVFTPGSYKPSRSGARSSGLPSVAALAEYDLLPEDVFFPFDKGRCPAAEALKQPGIDSLDALVKEGDRLRLYRSPLPTIYRMEHIVQKNIKEAVSFKTLRSETALALHPSCRRCDKLPFCSGVFTSSQTLSKRAKRAGLEVRGRQHQSSLDLRQSKARLEDIPSVYRKNYWGQAPTGVNQRIHAAICLTRRLGIKYLQVVMSCPQDKRWREFWNEFARVRAIELRWQDFEPGKDDPKDDVILRPLPHMLMPPLWSHRCGADEHEYLKRIMSALKEHMSLYLQSEAFMKMHFGKLREIEKENILELQLDSKGKQAIRILPAGVGDFVLKSRYFAIATTSENPASASEYFGKQLMLIKMVLERFEKQAWPADIAAL